jgi:hypothetical protein
MVARGPKDLNRATAARIAQRIVWSPQPRQAVLMSCPAQVTFFGGAKGGGKSDVLLGDFLAHADREGSKARGIIFRRTNSELEELEQRAHEIYPDVGGEYIRGKKTWIFPNGATLKMRFAERDADAMKYQGHNYSWIGIDEVGNYATSYFMNSMLSCLRSAKGAVCQMRLTGNPGGPGHGWLKRMFVDSLKPDHVHVFMQKIRNPQTKEVMEVEMTRAFVPSFIWDNAILIENDPAYVARLQTLPEHLRKAYLEGSWDIFIGQIFGEMEKGTHFIPPMILPYDWPRFATLDWGYAKPYSVGFWTVSPDGVLFRIHEIYGCVPGMANEGVKVDAYTVSKQIAPILNMMGIQDVFADSAMWQNHGNTLTIAELFEKGGVKLRPSRKDRKAGLDLLHVMMQDKAEDGGPRLRIFNTCVDFWRTMTSLVVDKNNPEDIDSTCEDHIFDECKYAVLTHYVQHLATGHQSGFKSSSYANPDRDYAR